MSKRYVVPVEVEELEEGGYLAICPTIPGCHAEGASISEAIEILQDVARVILEIRLEEGLGIPEGLEEAGPQTPPAEARILVAVG